MRPTYQKVDTNSRGQLNDGRGRMGERGGALMVLMAVVVMWGMSLALDALLIKSKRVRADKNSASALAEAKKALLAYAVVHADASASQFRLPCPFGGSWRDYQDSALEACGGSVVGRGFFPWKSMQLPPLHDADNTPIWYAVAAETDFAYACNGPKLTINNDTTTDYVAILFAPGDPLPGQSRPVGDSVSSATPGNYLESIDSGNPNNFNVSRVVTDSSSTASLFNDRLLGVSCSEIMNAVGLIQP